MYVCKYMYLLKQKNPTMMIFTLLFLIYPVASIWCTEINQILPQLPNALLQGCIIMFFNQVT